MKMSRRAARMQRQHVRRRPFTGFNLVALMDIFTILVFFLLVNSSDVEVLPTTQGLKLPESVAQKKPEERLVVMVNGEDIVVRGKKVAAVPAVLASSALIVEGLKTELDHYAQRASSGARSDPFRGEITIMGDKEIPFRLLKKVMVTCAHAKYTKVSLAVLQRGQRPE